MENLIPMVRFSSPCDKRLDTDTNIEIGLLYNLYADRLLGLNLVPESIYEMQSAFYPTVANEYGIPLDTRNTYTKC